MKNFIIILFYIFADQITKFFVVSKLSYGSYISVNQFVNIVNVSNTGIAFSMMQGQNLLFVFISLLVLAALIVFVKKYKKQMTPLQMHSILLILSGGIGNLIDRIFRGAVVDFIDVGIDGVYRWPSFNVADSCVCIGVALFIISNFFVQKKAEIKKFDR